MVSGRGDKDLDMPIKLKKNNFSLLTSYVQIYF